MNLRNSNCRCNNKTGQTSDREFRDVGFVALSCSVQHSRGRAKWLFYGPVVPASRQNEPTYHMHAHQGLDVPLRFETEVLELISACPVVSPLHLLLLHKVLECLWVALSIFLFRCLAIRAKIGTNVRFASNKVSSEWNSGTLHNRCNLPVTSVVQSDGFNLLGCIMCLTKLVLSVINLHFPGVLETQLCEKAKEQS